MNYYETEALCREFTQSALAEIKRTTWRITIVLLSITMVTIG
ncbi:MAG: hypothetical protein G01um101466_277 [Parcubacteria group bacterium Gr01-1014_66]|nr:MAG: hypothetical protein G01um101466_277 [Parcubacteria group bacterium Gr01-1014_66]